MVEIIPIVNQIVSKRESRLFCTNLLSIVHGDRIGTTRI